MSPLSFLVRPQSWLWAIHRYRATYSASPNFGFELCLAKIADDDLEGLDLVLASHGCQWRGAGQRADVAQFYRTVRPLRLPAKAMAPVYGLAENSVGLAFPPIGRVPVIDRIDRDELSSHGVANRRSPTPAYTGIALAASRFQGTKSGSSTRSVMSSASDKRDGSSSAGRRPRPAISATRRRRASCSTTTGSTPATVANGSGDIYVTGRIKDIIIRAGRHIYPQEIEEAVAEYRGRAQGRRGCIRRGRCCLRHGTRRHHGGDAGER